MRGIFIQAAVNGLNLEGGLQSTPATTTISYFAGGSLRYLLIPEMFG
jgi:hypothetical protein